MARIEITLNPTHGLQQSVDYPLSLVFGSEWALTPAHEAHLSLRAKLTDDAPLARFTTTDGSITLTDAGEGKVRVVVRIDGDVTRAWGLRPKPLTVGTSTYQVLSTYGSLIFTANGADHPERIDLALHWEASYNREGNA